MQIRPKASKLKSMNSNIDKLGDYFSCFAKAFMI